MSLQVAFSEKQTQTDKKAAEDSESESEDEDESEEESESESEDEQKADVVERGVQTDPLPMFQNNQDKKPQVC